jgi:hypothetical protein
MPAFKSVLAATLLIALAQPLASFAASANYDILTPTSGQDPTSAEMVADALVARPLYAAATVLGTAIFLVTLPFSALGGNVEQAANELVTGPAQGLMARCLGCIEPRREENFERAAE